MADHSSPTKDFPQIEDSTAALLHALPDPALLIDADGTIRAVNAAAASGSGRPKDELIGTNAYSCHDFSAITAGLERRIGEVIRSRKPLRTEELHDGKRYDHSLYPVIDTHGTVTQIVSITKDITQERQVKEERERLSKQVKEQERTFNGILSASDDRICVFDKDMCCTYVNSPGARALGLTPKDILGKTWKELGIPLEPMRQVIALADTVFATGRSQTGEFQWDRADGTAQCYEYVHAPIFNSRGDVVLIVSTFRNITERKQAEDALHRESLIDAALAALYAPLIDPTSDIADIMVAVRDQARSLTGSEHGYVSIIDPKTRDLISYSHTRMEGEGLCAVAEEGRGIVFPIGPDGRYNGLYGHALNTKKAFYTNAPAEHPAARGTPEGHIIIRRLLAVPVLIGEELVGDINVANANRDYTEEDLNAVRRLGEFYALAIQRMRAEENAESLAKFPEENPNPVMRLNAEGAILYANKPAKRLLDDWNSTAEGIAPQPLHDATIDALSNQSNRTIEVEARSRIYDFFVAPIIDAGYVNFYGRDVTERKRAEESLKKIEWLLTREPAKSDRGRERLAPPYGDVTALNTSRVIADSVGSDMLADIVDDYLELLDTSAAVYERDGSYALGLFTSGWCRLLDLASRERCGTDDNAEALRSGKWLCHESCWTDASKTSIDTGEPVDITCNGGIHIYAVPIYAGKKIVGSMNFGYGDPPIDPATLQALADLYGINNIGNLRETAEAYLSRPPYIIELAKDRLKTSARLVGEMVHRKQMDEKLQQVHEEVQALNEELQSTNEQLRFANETLEERVQERTLELQNEIEERKVVEGDLRAASEKVRAASLHSRSLIEASPDPLVTISAAGKITDVNKATEEVTGVSRAQLIGSDFSSYFMNPKKAKKGYEQVFEKGFVWDYPLAIRHTSGKITDVIYNATVYRNEAGEIQGVFAAARDVTKLKRAEKALRQAHDKLEQKVQERTFDLQEEIEERKVIEEELRATTEELQRSNKELEQFAYIASHDLQEPLRTVSSAIGLLEQGYKDKLGDEADIFITYAVDGAKQMQQLIKDLLAYSRVTSRGEVFKPVHCESVVQQAVDNLTAAIEESGAKIRLPDEPLPKVMGDKTQLTQLFQNLIGNAIKFRSEEPPEVQIDAELDGGGNIWRFSIKDNGIGMDMQYADKIFTIFQRLHTTEQYQGTGVGLALCKKIVERHNGKIWVDSKLGKGTTFYFTLPFYVE